MKFASLLLLAGALWLPTGAAGAEDLRFSVALGAADRAASGLARLTSDQVAVIDALVRRDTARGGASTTPATTGEKIAPTFSQRITEQERTTAGLPGLTADEVAKLDALVERQQGARLARTLLAPPSYIARSSRITPTERKKEREIHGSFSLSYGVGSGGYSEKTGSMMFTFDDPDGKYSISVGYSESHIKGGSGYYYYRDPFSELPRMTGPDDPLRP